MDKESVVLGCGCEVYGDEVEELKQRFRLLRLLIVSTALSMPLLWDLPPRFQFVLATVLQFGPGLYFIRNAIRGLKSRSLGMDMLVALSTTAIYVYSTVVVFTVTENIKLYYLCDGVLISLLLFGRAVAERLDKISTQARRCAGHVHGTENAGRRSLAFARIIRYTSPESEGFICL